MPIYSYECVKCGHKADEYMKMSSIPVMTCPKCREATYEKRVVLPHTDLIDFAQPVEMHSIGCTNMRQIREMQEAGVPCSDDPRDPLFGTPVARNRHEKKKALKVAGFVEAN